MDMVPHTVSSPHCQRPCFVYLDREPVPFSTQTINAVAQQSPLGLCFPLTLPVHRPLRPSSPYPVLAASGCPSCAKTFLPTLFLCAPCVDLASLSQPSPIKVPWLHCTGHFQLSLDYNICCGYLQLLGTHSAWYIVHALILQLCM